MSLVEGPPPFGSSWVKHYCMYRKAAKKFNIIPFEHRSGGKLVSLCFYLFIFKNIYLFIYYLFLAAAGLSCSPQDLQLWHVGFLVVACMWDLVPWRGVKPGCPALGVWSLTHWTTREVSSKSDFEGGFNYELLTVICEVEGYNFYLYRTDSWIMHVRLQQSFPSRRLLVNLKPEFTRLAWI